MADILSNDRLQLGGVKLRKSLAIFDRKVGHPLRSVTAPTPRPPHIIFGEKEVCNGSIPADSQINTMSALAPIAEITADL